MENMTQLSSPRFAGCRRHGTRAARRALIRGSGIALATLLLGGCAAPPPRPLVAGATTAAPAPPMPIAVNGSVFQPGQAMNYGYQPLFEDRRPRNIGDTLTIMLQENVSASKSSSSNADRKGKADLGINALPSMLNGLMGGDRLATDIESSNGFNGKGGAAAKNTFSGTITVTVIDVLTNGNLRVVGEKQIATNQGTEFIRFSGIVNPRTIDGNNQVVSTLVSDARIEYVGDGYINEAQQMGWLQRFFLNYFPF
ncbi:flagellar basal body L-ring protein FlgH [Sodalis sp. (in: enterobacteria)]|uniref:flagellar basal body L-ring protein FlgH n=1 Tax=Sodalis sp. (in: enterobacteria) TaxID=1898979 RepID=UPI003F30CD17